MNNDTTNTRIDNLITQLKLTSSAAIRVVYEKSEWKGDLPYALCTSPHPTGVRANKKHTSYAFPDIEDFHVWLEEMMHNEIYTEIYIALEKP